MDDLLLEATKKGMYLVDHDNTGPLLEEYDDVIAEADALCEVNDSVNAPYESKYKARTMLDQIINKMDATRAIAMLEKKSATMVALDRRLASAKVRVGTISWECEEPHNAQTELELACQYYFPGLVENITELSADHDVDAAGSQPGEHEKKVTPADIVPPPELPVLSETIVVDAMKALNLLGILWAGRGQVIKSMMFLMSAHNFYISNVEAAAKSPPLGQKSKFDKKTNADLGNAFTHNLFYLAQAYGNIGDTKKSCSYCHQTLQRQFTAEGFKDIHASLDWVKNCCGISDFYSAMRQFNNCALALSSAEWVLKKYAIPRILAADPAETSTIKMMDNGNLNYVSGAINAAEIEADLNRRWALLDVSVLKRAFERAKSVENAVGLGLKIEDILAELEDEEGPADPEDFDTVAHINLRAVDAKKSDDAPIATVFSKAESTAESGDADATAANTATTTTASAEVQFFTGIPVKPPTFLNRGDIKNFEDARQVFLRAAARIEGAKKYYVLDGKPVAVSASLTQSFAVFTMQWNVCTFCCRLRDRSRDADAGALEAVPLPVCV